MDGVWVGVWWSVDGSSNKQYYVSTDCQSLQRGFIQRATLLIFSLIPGSILGSTCMQNTDTYLGLHAVLYFLCRPASKKERGLRGTK